MNHLVSAPLIQSLIATLAVSATALIGIVFVITKLWSEQLEMILISVAAGVLLATAFLDLIPEAVAHMRPGDAIFSATLLAMIGFFFLERLLHGFHAHEDGHDDHDIAS